MADLKLVSLNDVHTEETAWLWPGWIAKGVLTFVVGEPGVGKSMMSWDLAAKHTNGGPWPTGESSRPGRALIVSGEDHLANWIVPRLKDYGADLNRVRSLDPASENPLRLDHDCAQLERLVEDDGIDLVIIDPLDAFLGDVNPNHGAEIRTITNGLSGMASRQNCAVVVLHHFNKNEGASNGNRVAGSIDIVGAARTVVYVVKNPSDSKSRALSVQKSNLGQRPRPMLYSLNELGCLQWYEAPDGFDLRSAMNSRVDGVVDEAIEFLKTVMAEHGREVRSSIALGQAKDAGISKNALDKAKARLGIRSRRVGGQSGYWVFTESSDSKAAA